MRRLLSLKRHTFDLVLERGGQGMVAYFATVLLERSGEPVVLDKDNQADINWLDRVRGHFQPLGFSLQDPDEDGVVELRFVTAEKAVA